MLKNLPLLPFLRGGFCCLFLLYSLTTYAQLSVEVEGENIGCFGLSSGTATATVTDGTAPYTYLWSNGGTTATITNLNAGTYGVTVTDANSLTGSGSITLTEPTRVTATISDPIECNAPYTIAAEPQGGVVPYTYNWSTGADTRGISVPAGDYCVTVVDANLCGYVACTTVEDNPPSVTLVDVDAQCNDANDGAITANPSGGVAPYSYSWSNGGVTQTITDLAPGVYRVTLTDARGCTATAAATISEPPAITGNIFGDASVCPGEADAFIRIAPQGGTPPYSYVWSPGGFTGQGVGPLPAGTYQVLVTDANGCTITRSFVITTSDEVEVEITGDLLLCGAGTTGSLSAAPVSGPVNQYTYEWSTGATSPTITNVGAGTYTVTATDANGCTGTATAEVTVVDLDLTLSSTPITCDGDNDGTATATVSGGQQPYTYLWSNGATTSTITGLAPGVYGVTVTEVNNCKVSGNILVTSPDPLIISVDPENVECDGDNNGSIDLTVSGGTQPYTYLWNNGATTEDISGLSPGTYSPTVTDANGCTATTSVAITAPNPIVINPTVNNLGCADDGSGSIFLQVTGGTPAYTYAWSNGAMTRNITGLSAGDYIVTVTDANDCELVASYTVTAPDPLEINDLVVDVLCNGDATGAIGIDVEGGTPPYSYAWSNGVITEDNMNIPAGDYSVTVTDANECEATADFTVEEPPALTITAIPTNVSCNGGNDGAINVTVNGGTPGYTYAWSNGATTEDLSNLTAGIYDLTVTDANGCTENTRVTITEPSQLDATASVTPVACGGEATGAIDLSVFGGAPGYTYAWNNGAATQDLNNLIAGDYSVTITDANGCTLTEDYTITEPTPLEIDHLIVNVLCNGDVTGAIGIDVEGGSPPYSYVWSNGVTTEDNMNIPAGDYSVTVLDANECEITADFTVTAPPVLTINTTSTNLDCNGGDDGTIDVTSAGGTQPYTYAWSDGATTEDRTSLAAGTYGLTVTDANGCTENTSITISEPPALNATAAITPVACAGEATGAIDLSVFGGTPGYTYAWSNGATTQDLSNLAAGTYTVIITDANDCTLTEEYEVAANPNVVINGTATPANCNGEASGDIDITVSGGSGTYSYAWSNGATTEDLTGIPAGDYSVTVMDGNECDATASFTVTEPAEIDLTITAPNITCGGTATGNITVFPAGGTGPYTYLWSNGDTGNVIENVGAGSYTVTVTDANGCSDVTSGIVLGEIPQLTCEVQVVQEPTTGNNGELTVVVDGGTIPYTYAWSNGAATAMITNLNAGTYSVTVTDANGCTTECSNTLRALSGIGDFVWEDFDADGQQDPGEPGIEDYPVYLKDAAGNIIDSTRTNADGNYSFMGLEPGTYSILFINPPGGRRTLANIGGDETDSDGDPAMDGMTQNYTLVPGEFNMTVDAGFVANPDAAITDPCSCLNNNTTDFDGQLLEILDIVARPGQTWTITANSFMYEFDSPDPPAAPIPIPLGTIIPQEELLPDNMALYKLKFLLVDSFRYTVEVTNGVFTLEFSNQCFYPEVRFTESPPDSLCRFEAPIQLEGFGRLNGMELPGTTTFTINGESATEIDPMNLPLGEYTIVAEFVPDDPDECIPSLERQIFLIDECDAKIGDQVWEDTNRNGLQDPGEPGIPNVKVTVTSQDGSYMDMTTTDGTGMYMFFVPPGTYKVTFEQPEDLNPTTPNAGDDELDSDINPGTLMTPFYTVGPDEMNLTIDAGFVNPCIQNVSNPGTIAASQELCGPGNVPQPLTEIAPATGGIGEIEYLWMFNTEDAGQDISYWTPIPNSNTLNYAPGPVFETTFFTRCVRRNNCPFIESNVLTIEVGDDAVANISGPSVVCVGEDAIFQAVNPGTGGQQISWSFSGSSAVTSANGAMVTTSWATFGSFSATLTVTRNGCTSTQTVNVSVVNNPNRCGGNLVANGTVNNLQAREVGVEWQVPADGTDYAFSVERSLNGMTFEPIADVNAPAFVSGNDMATYRLEDVSPLAGRTFYRVRMLDAEYGDMLSNIVELQLAEETVALGRVFPNPASNGMIHVEMTELASEDAPVGVQLYDVRGNTAGAPQFLQPGTGVINLMTSNLSAGMYFLRLTVNGQTETHRVIIE